MICTIFDAMYDYARDNNGMPDFLPTEPTEICRTNVVSCDGLVSLDILVDNRQYLNFVPIDPDVVLPNGTGYTIARLPNGKLSVFALYAEKGQKIGVTW